MVVTLLEQEWRDPFLAMKLMGWFGICPNSEYNWPPNVVATKQKEISKGNSQVQYEFTLNDYDYESNMKLINSNNSYWKNYKIESLLNYVDSWLNAKMSQIVFKYKLMHTNIIFVWNKSLKCL